MAFLSTTGTIPWEGSSVAIVRSTHLTKTTFFPNASCLCERTASAANAQDTQCVLVTFIMYIAT